MLYTLGYALYERDVPVLWPELIVLGYRDRIFDGEIK
jgi:hypothetical protein